MLENVEKIGNNNNSSNNNNFISRGKHICQSCQSNIWSLINKCWHDIIKMNRHACTIISSMYRVNALRTPSRLRAGYPTLLQWRGRYDFSRLKTSRVLPHTSVLVIECFLTRSMLFLKCISTLYTVIISPAKYQKLYLS